MVWLRGFHGDEVTEAPDSENNADIGATLALVEQDTEVTGMEEGNIALTDVADKRFSRFDLSGKEKARLQKSRF